MKFYIWGCQLEKLPLERHIFDAQNLGQSAPQCGTKPAQLVDITQPKLPRCEVCRTWLREAISADTDLSVIAIFITEGKYAKF